MVLIMRVQTNSAGAPDFSTAVPIKSLNEAIEEAVKQNYSEGYDDGYNRGWDEGYEAGRREAYEVD